METTSDSFDNRVRQFVYDYVLESGQVPSIGETASALLCGIESVTSSFERLAEAHIFVLQKGSGEILMANPISAIPTPFLVRSGNTSIYANCIRDAMGIPAMLNRNAIVEASCGCCGTSMNLEIENGLIKNGNGLVHFAVPAARWWDDIVYN